MSKVKTILRLLKEGHSKRKISELSQVSRNTIDKYESTFKAHPLGYVGLSKLTSKELYSIIEPPAEHTPSHDELYRMFPEMEQQLKRVGITRQFLWEGYKEKYPDGVQYSQFCEHFKRYQKSQHHSYIFDHKAGDKLMVDFAGKKLFLTDPDTGEQQSVEFFVAVLACSGYTYARASMSQQGPDFLGSIVHCLDFLEGVPNAIVTDNLKPAVIRASKYDPQLNHSMADLGEHYQTTILPTRAHSPKDKALVENAVNILYTRVFAPLHDKVFHTLEQLNVAILPLVMKHNDMLFQRKDVSRTAQFINIEKQQLRPLPPHPFILRTYQKAKAHPNCHIMLTQDKHHYSIPYLYVGQVLEISYCSTTVEIYHKLNRIATHMRVRQPHTYTTDQAHLHPKHAYMNTWSEQTFIKRGNSIGENTGELIKQVLLACKHPEQGFKRCEGILQLAKKYTPIQVEQAALLCVQYDYITYQRVQYMFENYEKIFQSDFEGQSVIPVEMHDNIRGEEYYK